MRKFVLCEVEDLDEVPMNSYFLEPIDLKPGEKAYGFEITRYNSIDKSSIGKQLVVVHQEEIEAVRNFLMILRG